MDALQRAGEKIEEALYTGNELKLPLTNIHKNYINDKKDVSAGRKWNKWKRNTLPKLYPFNIFEFWTSPQSKKREVVLHIFRVEENRIRNNPTMLGRYRKKYPKLMRHIQDRNIAQTVIDRSFRNQIITEDIKWAAEKELDTIYLFGGPFSNVWKRIKGLFASTKRNVALQPPEEPAPQGTFTARQRESGITPRSTNRNLDPTVRSDSVIVENPEDDTTDTTDETVQPAQPEDSMGRVFREIKWWGLVSLICLVGLSWILALIVQWQPEQSQLKTLLNGLFNVNSLLIIVYFALHAFGSTLFDVHKFLSSYDETRQHNVYEDQSLEKIIFSSLYFYTLGFIRILYFLAFWYIVCVFMYTLFKYPFWAWVVRSKERHPIEEKISNAVRETFHPRKLMRFARIDSQLYPMYFAIVLSGIGFLILYGIVFHRLTANCKPEVKRTVRANRFLIGQGLVFAMVSIMLMIVLVIYLLKQ